MRTLSWITAMFTLVTAWLYTTFALILAILAATNVASSVAKCARRTCNLLLVHRDIRALPSCRYAVWLFLEVQVRLILSYQDKGNASEELSFEKVSIIHARVLAKTKYFFCFLQSSVKSLLNLPSRVHNPE